MDDVLRTLLRRFEAAPDDALADELDAAFARAGLRDLPRDALARVARWRPVTRFVSAWYRRPLVGHPDEDVDRAEARLGRPLPQPVRELYRLLGRGLSLGARPRVPRLVYLRASGVERLAAARLGDLAMDLVLRQLLHETVPTHRLRAGARQGLLCVDRDDPRVRALPRLPIGRGRRGDDDAVVALRPAAGGLPMIARTTAAWERLAATFGAALRRRPEPGSAEPTYEEDRDHDTFGPPAWAR